MSPYQPYVVRKIEELTKVNSNYKLLFICILINELIYNKILDTLRQCGG